MYHLQDSMSAQYGHTHTPQTTKPYIPPSHSHYPPPPPNVALSCIQAEVAAAVAGADCFFGSLLFDYDTVEWLRAQLSNVPTVLVFESALELMGMTHIGSFTMDPSGETSPPPNHTSLLPPSVQLECGAGVCNHLQSRQGKEVTYVSSFTCMPPYACILPPTFYQLMCATALLWCASPSHRQDQGSSSCSQEGSIDVWQWA